MARPYPEVPSQPRLAELEERVLAYWKEQDLFRASVANRPAGKNGANEFVFYDGPPFANGLPHYGHLLTSYVKDIVPRYQTMRGKRVERRFGWDCHGLPAEMESEKELGISGRARITEYGIERFNAHCRSSVMKYTKEWEGTVTRAARWVDFAHDYKTMDLAYMESVMWAFAELFKKGLVYESYRVMPYSWAAETPVSNFETRMDNSYRERQDPALTVRFALERVSGDTAPTELWAWTTTPWTLPSNLALAVGPELEYAVFEKDEKRVVLGASVLAKYEKELAGAVRVTTLKGRELVGRRYTPLFPYFAGTKNAFRVLAGDFVDTSEGTGVVHMAPGFGEDDQRVCAENQIAIVCPVDEKGRFTAEVPEWQGVNVFEANKPIIAALKQRNVLVRHDTLVHNYPHCWRTDQPLIYRALSSWYVKVTAIREQMVALNQKIHWVPEHVRDGQFGKWLEGARDWSISRNRFWGSPIPVWRSPSGKLKVFGSIAELEQASGQKITDLHRPFVDQLVIREGGEEYRRVEEVLDCWFESGSMPFAQVHYPFENKEWFETHAPADFIVEYVAQTRGWFYTLMVLSTALFGREPFKNCICHGVVLDENGLKLSKRLKNFRSPEEVFATQGSDALRWYLCSSPILRGGDLVIDKDGKAIGEIVRLVIHPIWNAYSFFALYANADKIQASVRSDASGVLDRYILAKLRTTVERVTAAMDAYDLAGACAEIRAFLDALNNWYIRRSRARFWRGELDQDKKDAYDTLYTVLTTLCRLAAPFLPFVTEEVYRGLTGEKSVHLADWPEAAKLPADAELVLDMDRVREVCSVALGLREEKRLRVRLPLGELVVAAEWARSLEPYAELIASEVNIKNVMFSPRPDAFATLRYSVNSKKAGPRLGAKLKAVLGSLKGPAPEVTLSGAELVVQTAEGAIRLLEGEWESALQQRPEVEARGQALAPLADRKALVALNTLVTPELEREGLARDLVRVIQQARKDAKLNVSDRIRLRVSGDAALGEAVNAHKDYICTQTLAKLELGPPEAGMFSAEGEVGETKATVGVVRA
ncbi:MAG: isoleucine--tRNA ligase [Planctomycetes bacterium]|nr:isoleucine--tRNA ligase [Planctomycetota bacterium]